MEVLLEYETSHCLLKPSGGIITRCALEDVFKTTGWSDMIDIRDMISMHKMDEVEHSMCNNTYILQRWEINGIALSMLPILRRLKMAIG